MCLMSNAEIKALHWHFGASFKVNSITSPSLSNMGNIDFQACLKNGRSPKYNEMLFYVLDQRVFLVIGDGPISVAAEKQKISYQLTFITFFYQYISLKISLPKNRMSAPVERERELKEQEEYSLSKLKKIPGEKFISLCGSSGGGSKRK